MAGPSDSITASRITEKVRVAVRDNEVVLNDFHETDPEVLSLARDADDPEGAVHNALEVGARAIKLAEISQDASVVEAAFQELSGTFDRKLDDTLRQMGDATDALFSADGGAIPQALHSFRSQLAELLGDAFDPDSKRSIIAKFDRLLRDVRTEERDALRELLDPGNDRSPLHRLHRDLTKSVRDEAEGTRHLVNELSRRVAVSAAEAEMFEMTSLKGAAFEDVLHRYVCELTAPLGDSAEQTGQETGCSGTRKGDEVVTLNTDDTHGHELRFTYEAKDRKLSLKAILGELEAAMENRDADAAVAVFSNQGHAPTAVPFSYIGDKAIVVLDKEDPDPRALQLATMWARWVVRRKVASAGCEIDTAAIEGLIAEAAEALNRHTTIKRCHSTAAKKISEASNQIAALVSDVNAALERLRAELAAD